MRDQCSVHGTKDSIFPWMIYINLVFRAIDRTFNKYVNYAVACVRAPLAASTIHHTHTYRNIFPHCQNNVCQIKREVFSSSQLTARPPSADAHLFVYLTEKHVVSINALYMQHTTQTMCVCLCMLHHYNNGMHGNVLSNIHDAHNIPVYHMA